jgi:hypothetical protein
LELLNTATPSRHVPSKMLGQADFHVRATWKRMKVLDEERILCCLEELLKI